MSNYLYCTATNTGKGFITLQDRKDFSIKNFGGVYVVENNLKSSAWISRVSGTSKTYTEAQTIMDTATANNQSIWDNSNVDGETSDEKIERIGIRPDNIILPN